MFLIKFNIQLVDDRKTDYIQCFSFPPLKRDQIRFDKIGTYVVKELSRRPLCTAGRSRCSVSRNISLRSGRIFVQPTFECAHTLVQFFKNHSRDDTLVRPTLVEELGSASVYCIKCSLHQFLRPGRPPVSAKMIYCIYEYQLFQCVALRWAESLSVYIEWVLVFVIFGKLQCTCLDTREEASSRFKKEQRR